MVDKKIAIPVGVKLNTDIEFRPGATEDGNGYRARVRWFEPQPPKRRRSKSDTFKTEDEAVAWLNELIALAQNGVDPGTATQTLAEYGQSVMKLAIRDLELKTRDPYLAGWRKRVVPTLGHLPFG